MSSVAPFVPKHRNSYGSHILHQMAEQQENSILTDFILSSQGQELKCHRTLLAAVSPYFSAMFSSGMKEAEQGKAILDHVDFTILEYVVHFMYGKCPSMSWDNVEELLDTCEWMQLSELKKQLDVYVADNLTAVNCITWWKNAEKFNLGTTEEKAKSLMISEFQNVSKSEDFMKLTYAEIVDYIHIVEKSVPYQDHILYAMTGWVAADIDQRKSFMMDVLKLANLAECSSAAMKDVTKTQSDLFTDPDVMRFIYQSIIPKLEKEKNQSVFVLGGTSEYIETCYTYCWQYSVGFANSSWQIITTIPDATVGKQPSFVCIPNGFAVICGGDSKKVNAKYDLQDEIWTDLPDTPEKLTDTVALYTDGNIHVLDGGKYDNVITDKMYTLNLQNIKWNRGPNLLEEQYHPIATAYKQSLWVVYNDDVNKKSPCTFQQLAPDASKWVYKASLPANVWSTGGCLVGYKENLFFIGGLYDNCVSYTISTDQWTDLTSKPSVNHEYGSAFVQDQKIYVCGGGWDGSSNHQVTDCIEEYDPEANQWTVATNKLPMEMTFVTAGLSSAN